MSSKIIDIVKDIVEGKASLSKLEKICSLCDTVRLSYTLEEAVDIIFKWLNNNYQIKDFKFFLNDLEKDINSIILQEGQKFGLDDPYAFYFIVDTRTDFNAVISFKAKDKKDFDLLTKEYNHIEILLDQISPVLQSMILKKLHLEANSVDTITHVYSRQYLIEHINKTAQLKGQKKDEITFLMVGIDRFKAVIDEFDFDIGDKVLIKLAKVIHSNIKNKDIVARLTGDEFLVALMNQSDKPEIEIICKNMIEQFSKVKVLVNAQTNQTLQKTICIGISLYPKDGDNIDSVIKNADMFLTEAKNKGRGSFSFFEKHKESGIDFF